MNTQSCKSFEIMELVVYLMKISTYWNSRKSTFLHWRSVCKFVVYKHEFCLSHYIIALCVPLEVMNFNITLEFHNKYISHFSVVSFTRILYYMSLKSGSAVSKNSACNIFMVFPLSSFLHIDKYIVCMDLYHGQIVPLYY